MSDFTNLHFLGRGRRRVLTLAVGTAALAVAGAGTGIAAASAHTTPSPGKIVGHGPANLSPQGQVAGTSVTLAPGGYGHGTVTCPVNTEVFGGGESNSGPGTLVLTDSWPSSNTSWLVYVKNNGTTTATFTPYAICR